MTTELGTIHFERRGSTAFIIFDRPSARNAMTWAMYEKLDRALDRLTVETDLRVAVLRGAGGHFAAGTDIAQFAAFLGVLARHVDATGVSLLDRACILGLSEYGEGWQHSVAEMPALLAGGACGRLRRMVHVREPGGNFSKVHVTALRALGLTVPEYGFNGGATTEHLAGMLA